MFENLPSSINAANSKTEVKLFADYMKAGIFQEVYRIIFNTILIFLQMQERMPDILFPTVKTSQSNFGI